MNRHCHITSASVNSNNGSDGAYDIYDIEGTPKEIGKAITECLKEVDMDTGGKSIMADMQECLEIQLTIRVTPAKKILSTRSKNGCKTIEVFEYQPNQYRLWIGEDTTDRGSGLTYPGDSEDILHVLCEVLTDE